jgi:hypothetical protein
MPSGRGVRAGQTAARVAGYRGWTPVPLFEKMIRQVFQAGLDSPIIFGGNENETIRVSDLLREPFHCRGSRTLRIFFVHSIEHRQTDRLGIDQFDVVAAGAETFQHVIREPDAHSLGSIGAVEYEYPVRRCARNPLETLKRDVGAQADHQLVPDLSRRIVWIDDPGAWIEEIL